MKFKNILLYCNYIYFILKNLIYNNVCFKYKIKRNKENNSLQNFLNKIEEHKSFKNETNYLDNSYRFKEVVNKQNILNNTLYKNDLNNFQTNNSKIFKDILTENNDEINLNLKNSCCLLNKEYFWFRIKKSNFKFYNNYLNDKTYMKDKIYNFNTFKINNYLKLINDNYYKNKLEKNAFTINLLESKDNYDFKLDDQASELFYFSVDNSSFYYTEKDYSTQSNKNIYDDFDYNTARNYNFKNNIDANNNMLLNIIDYFDFNRIKHLSLDHNSNNGYPCIILNISKGKFKNQKLDISSTYIEEYKICSRGRRLEGDTFLNQLQHLQINNLYCLLTYKISINIYKNIYFIDYLKNNKFYESNIDYNVDIQNLKTRKDYAISYLNNFLKEFSFYDNILTKETCLLLKETLIRQNYLKNINFEFIKKLNNNSAVLLYNNIQPLVLLPFPTNRCNQNWSYLQKGNDWQCKCNDGLKQSPINISTSEVLLFDIHDFDKVPFIKYSLVEFERIYYNKKNLFERAENLKIELTKEGQLLIDSWIDKMNFSEVILPMNNNVHRCVRIKVILESEHTINNKHYPMEIQLICIENNLELINNNINGVEELINNSKSLVTFVFMFEEKAGVFNKFIDDIDFFSLPDYLGDNKPLKYNLYLPKLFESIETEYELKKNKTDNINYQISSDKDENEFSKFINNNEVNLFNNITDILKKNLKDNSKEINYSFYFYEGSLTSPPCSENNYFFVKKDAIPICSSMIKLLEDKFKKIYYDKDIKKVNYYKNLIGESITKDNFFENKLEINDNNNYLDSSSENTPEYNSFNMFIKPSNFKNYRNQKSLNSRKVYYYDNNNNIKKQLNEEIINDNNYNKYINY